MKIYHSLTAGILALNMLYSPAVINAFAEETVQPVNLDASLCELLLKENKYVLDSDSDGIISEEEAQNCRYLYLNLDDFTELNWLKAFPNLVTLGFRNGTITDFSVLKEIPKLRNLEFDTIPLTDISFLKDLNLETCRLREMKQISLEQRIAVLNWNDYKIQQGFAKDVGIQPLGLLDDYSVEMTLDDSSIANFISSYHSGERNEVYGVSAGKTSYHIFADEQEILSGKITVSELEFDSPALAENPAEQIAVLNSEYYANRTAVLIDGTLYGIKGSQVTAVQEHVKNYDHVDLKNDTGSYISGDIVLLEDGTLLVNDKEIAPSQKFIQAENGCVIDENHKIYVVYPKGEDFILKQLSGDFKAFPYKTNHYYVTQNGELMYYDLEYVSGTLKLTSSDTGIKNPISGYDDMFVDENHVFWVCKIYPSLKVTKSGENAVEAGRYVIKSGGAVYGYLSEDGKVHQAVTDTEYELADKEQEQSDFAKMGGFYIHEYTTREENPLLEQDAGVRWFLTYDNVLTLSFCDKQYAISDGLQAVCAEYDEELQKGYAYFLRTDGTLWQYCLETEEVQQITETSRTPEFLKGDANGDGIFSAQDIIQLQKWLKHDGTTLSNWKACDLNEDQILNIYDWILMKRLLLNS